MDPKTVSLEAQKRLIGFITKSRNSEEFEIIPLAGDASSRKYFRVIQGEKSMVLMLWEPFVDDGNYPFLSVLRHFDKHNVNVPTVVNISPEGGMVLLEDLGDLTLERKFWENQDQNLSIPFYKMALDELIKIHFHATKDVDKSCTAFKIQFDTEKFLWEMNYGREHFLEKLCHIELSDSQKKSLSSVFTTICDKLHKEPKFISHRDYHSRNLMLKLNQMCVIDFQDARLGPIQYDLVSLFHDSYVKLKPETIEPLMQYYLDQAKEFLPHSFSRDQFDEVFKLQKIQRCFKACGSFASFYNTRGDERYLKYISRTIKKVAYALQDLNEYKDFLALIESHGLLERKYEVS